MNLLGETADAYFPKTLLIQEVPGCYYGWFLKFPYRKEVNCSHCGSIMKPPCNPKFDNLNQALDWCIENGVFLDEKPEYFTP